MPSYIDSFRINGLIDPKNNVLDNINKIADAALIWVTYDATTGKGGASFNDTDTSVYSFDDSNIIGGINVSGTGLGENYNKVSVEYPHKDIRDQTDFVDVSIAAGDRFDNELDNTLNLKLDLVNNPVQAQYIATVELKSSRLDKIIEFRTDYTGIGFIAGVVIDVTSSQYGFGSKLFRVTRVEEIDNDDGGIEFSITAIEYDANVYSTAGLVYDARSRASGIKPKITNTEIKEMDDRSTGTDLLRLLGLNLATGLFNSALTKNATTGKVTQTVTPTSASRDATLSKVKKPAVTISGVSEICEGQTLTLTLDLCAASCLFDPISYDYTITGVTAPDITPFPLTGTVNVPGTMTIPIADDAAVEGETLTVTIGSVSKAVSIRDRLGYTYVTDASPTSVTEGNPSTVTLTTTNVADGTVVPYTITGSGTSRVSTALTGNVTVNSNTATLTVNTIDDAVYQGNQTVTVTFNPSQADYCGELDKTAVITINDNESPPTTCEYVSVPVVWCGQYNGADNQLEAVTVRKYALLPVAQAGEATVNVPLTVTVSKGNPSTITVATTTPVASANNLGGIPFNVIHSFNSVQPSGLITGSHYVVYGY